MKVIQSAKDTKSFHASVGDNEFDVYIRSKAGGVRVYAELSVNKSFLGRIDLLNPKTLLKVFEDYKRKQRGWSKHFVDENDFQQQLIDIYLAIKGNEYEVEVIKKTLSAEPTPQTIAFLSKPTLIDEIDTILRGSHSEPFIKLDRELLASFLTILSCKTPFPLTMEVVGPSSSGKTYCVLRAALGFPEEILWILAGATKEALKYEASEKEDENYIVNVDERCLIVLEKEDSKAFVKKMKPLMSHDKSELLYKTTVANATTGERATRNYIVRGNPSFVTITTHDPDDIEEITRRLLMTPATTEEIVGEVIHAIFGQARKLSREMTTHPDQALLKHSVKTLKKMNVVNPFLDLIADHFPTDSPQRMRDAKKVRTLIETVTILHQQQRVKIGDNDVMSSVEDNFVGLILFDTMMGATMTGIPELTNRFYEEVLKDMDSKSKALTLDYILKDAGAKGWSADREIITSRINTLYNRGLLFVKKSGAGRGGKRIWGITAEQSLRKEATIVPLTQIFLERLQLDFDYIFKQVAKDYLNQKGITPPAVKTKGARLTKLTGKEGDLAQYLLQFNYFGKAKLGNVLWNVCEDEELRRRLFRFSHPLASKKIKTSALERYRAGKDSQEEIDEKVVGDQPDEEDWHEYLRGVVQKRGG